MNLRFIEFTASDHVRLPGLLYTPDVKTDRVAIWLHGMGDNGVFYKTNLINALGEALTKQGIALLAFNNRGAHDSKRLRILDDNLLPSQQSLQAGTHYELIADCVFDIDGAAKYAQNEGFKTLYLLGHSTGANKIAVYNAKRPKNPFSKYVLAGIGDDSGLFYTELGHKKFWQAFEYARGALENGQPLQIMPKYTGMAPFSAQSAYDILNPDGDYSVVPFYEHSSGTRLGSKMLFDTYSAITKPMQVIMGAEDEFQYTAGGAEAALQIMLNYTSARAIKQADFQLVPGANHSFYGAETAFAGKVADWLAHG